MIGPIPHSAHDAHLYGAIAASVRVMNGKSATANSEYRAWLGAARWRSH